MKKPPPVPQKFINSLPTKRVGDWPIADLPGLSDRDSSALQSAQIQTTSQLLAMAQSQRQQFALAQNLKIHPRSLRKWCILADLAQVPSVGCQHCGLLLHVGITSVAQLAEASAQLLHQKLLRLQVQTLQQRDLCPTASLVQQWVVQAKQLVN